MKTEYEKGPFKVRWLPATPGYNPGWFRPARNSRTKQLCGVVIGRLFIRWRDGRVVA